MAVLRDAIREALADAGGDEYQAALLIVRRLRDPDFRIAFLKPLEPRLKLLAPTLREASASGTVADIDPEVIGAEVRTALVRVLLDVIREEEARGVALTGTQPTA